jgi:hypothetical protein
MRWMPWFGVWCCLLIGASLTSAAGVEIVTPSLFAQSGPDVQCLVTNVSHTPQAVTWEVLDGTGQQLGDLMDPSIPPLGSRNFNTVRNPLDPIVICRAVSRTANKGDLKLTLCHLDATLTACRVVVTAE